VPSFVLEWWKNGAPEGIRTSDLCLRRAVVILAYIGIAALPSTLKPVVALQVILLLFYQPKRTIEIIFLLLLV
jgi:hypothetical protein